MKQAVTKYFPHLAGSLVLGSAALWTFMGPWESGSAEPVLVVYADRLAGGLPTVCHGLTRHVTDTPIVVGQRWTKEQCAEEEQRAMVKVQTQLAHCFKVLPPQNVFDAFSSHAWNNGAPGTCNSMALKAWNAGDQHRACQRLSLSDAGRPVWSYVWTGKYDAQGKKIYRFVQGLANRRNAETTYCREADDV